MTTTAVLVAPSPTITVDIVEAVLTAPAATLESEAMETARVAVKATPALLRSTSLTGTIGTAAVVQASPVLTTQFISAEVVAPVPVFESTGIGGTIGSSVLRAKASTLTSTGINQTVQSATLVAKAARLTSTGLTGTIGTAALVARSARLTSTAAGGQTSAVTLLAPSPRLTAVGATGAVATAILTAPRVVFAASALQALSTFATWCMNVEAPALTNYTNFNFHSLVKLGNVYLGANSEGFYALTGDDDDGTVIDATLRFGYTDFDSPQLKRVPAVYLGGRFAGGLDLLVKVDKEEKEWIYTLDPVETDLDVHLIPVGRGLRARYWQFGLRNKLGADFELDTVDVAEQILTRRVG